MAAWLLSPCLSRRAREGMTGLGALAATLAASHEFEGYNFPLVADILGSHGICTAMDLAMAGTAMSSQMMSCRR